MIFRDTVHLSWDGRRKLVDNYIATLNNCWLFLENENAPIHSQTPGSSDEGDSENDIDKLNKLRAKNIQNPVFVYYNINSVRSKFDELNT